MNTVSINKELISWARERAGLEVDDLIKSFPKFIEWEEGTSSPTLTQLEKLARKLYAPLGYFFLPKPPDEKLPIPDFRSVHDTPIQHPSPDLLETVFEMQRRQDWFREFIIEEGAEPLAFVGCASMRDKPGEVAKRMRATLGITAGWASASRTWEDAFGNLWLNCEQVGLLVVCNGIVGNNTNRILDVEEFRGFVLPDSYAPLVFINNADAKAAQMFTLAHELAHIWIGSAGVLNFRQLEPADNETERFCNQVAAEFLVPKDELAAMWDRVKSFYPLADHFKVSPLVIARRTLDAGYIQRSDFFGFYNSYMANVRTEKAAKEPGGNFYHNCEYRIGQPFASAVARAVKAGRLLYRDAYRLTGLQGPTFDQYVLKISRESG
ncbi:MAG TPA: ImmA/IrrE family metallo-endopeptidase [Candidatus Acidoferrum sp.]|jgi:Zn-dependent peptidase ImmA (M78 family)|nr:ImmA/IrrE family metallo-endopeptidase [Candidatus Acidoferrum sp.]